MFFNFFKPKKVNFLNLSQLFEKHCSLPFNKTRSPATRKLADIIKKNAVLNCDENRSNFAKLNKDELAANMDKITNVFNAIDVWIQERKDKSERLDKILIFRNNVLKPFAKVILKEYQEKGGLFEERWNSDAAFNKQANSPRLGYNYNRCFSFVIGLPFISQVFDAMSDLLGLLN